MDKQTKKPKQAAKGKEPRKRGRPSPFYDLDMHLVEILVKKGFTDEEMAEALKIDRRTWENWKEAHPDFFHTIKDWKDEADQAVIKALYQKAIGYSHPEEKIFCSDGEIVRAQTVKQYPPDTAAIIHWLNNRQRKTWKNYAPVQEPPQGEEGEMDIFDAVAKEMGAQR